MLSIFGSNKGLRVVLGDFYAKQRVCGLKHRNGRLHPVI